jgi:(4S)-4-hydroxy-5-phosphonooxypentane-2,3-dione isomerase
MAKQAVVVRYRVKPGRMGEVLPLLRAHVARTKAAEPGCVQFDILLPHSEADTVHLYEVYADQAALELHNASKGLATYKSQTDPLLFERAVTWCTVEE